MFNKIDHYLTNKIAMKESPTKGESSLTTMRGTDGGNSSRNQNRENKYRRYFSETKVSNITPPFTQISEEGSQSPVRADKINTGRSSTMMNSMMTTIRNVKKSTDGTKYQI